MDFLYQIPAGLLLIAVLAIAIALAGFGQTYVHRRFREGDFVGHNEVGGIIIAVSGTIYAVILGFLTVVAWEHFQEARNLVVLESDADIDVWHAAVGLPEAVRNRVRADMKAYAEAMIAREWPAMRQGHFDQKAQMIGMDAINAIGGFVPANNGESNAQAAAMQQLTIMHDARQQRMAVNAGGISWFEWLVLAVGGMSIVCFCWLFGLRNPRTHLLMTSTVVTMIASILVLLFELQYPFRSDIGIGPDLWKGAHAHLHEMENGDMAGMRM